MFGSGTRSASFFANLAVFRANERVAKYPTEICSQVIENMGVRERLKSLPR
jgi:hypothetical protein